MEITPDRRIGRVEAGGEETRTVSQDFREEEQGKEMTPSDGAGLVCPAPRTEGTGG